MKDLLLIAVLIAIGLGIAIRSLKAENRVGVGASHHAGAHRFFESNLSSGLDDLVSSVREIAARRGNQEEREEAALALVDLIDDGVLAVDQGVQMVGLLVPAV
ncbi:MAG: hypothetical protein KDD64_10225 [Bdellovibrionales bacterium]|nr:hypothetical protein [Bdellovibrionales bacterium]